MPGGPLPDPKTPSLRSQEAGFFVSPRKLRTGFRSFCSSSPVSVPRFRFLRVVLLCGPFVFCCFSGLLAVSRHKARPSLTAQARGSDDSGSNELGRTRRSWRRGRTRGTPFATFTRIREWSRPAILSHRKRSGPPAHSGHLRATQVTSGCIRAKTQGASGQKKPLFSVRDCQFRVFFL